MSANTHTALSGPLRVIGYCRVSTDKQGEHGHGLQAQRDMIAQRCAVLGYELLTVTTDVVSGSNAAAMHGRAVAIAAIEAGVADVLMVRALDRATRSQLDHAALFEQAARNSWRIMDCDGADSGDPAQRLTADVRNAVAAEERRKISERTREGLARARHNGSRLGRPPKVERGSALARRVARMRAKGMSANAIADQLTVKGVPTPGGGRKWHHSTIRDVLKREVVAEERAKTA